MYSVPASWLTHEVYEQGLTAMSIVIVIFSGWLVGMMLTRMISDRHVSGHDVAAMTYVGSTTAVFFVIAGRFLWEWPEWLTFMIILVKCVSVVMITIWARLTKETGVVK